MGLKMKATIFRKSIFSLILLGVNSCAFAQKMPEIVKWRNADFQLLVDGKPFLIRGGELGNSVASDTNVMKPVWPKLRAMNLNTVLAPVYWELLEPQEGTFDFSLVDAMIAQARENQLRLVFLWFGSWKNSMSCYAPDWVKKDYKRFPRTLDSDANPAEILSAFSNEAMNADIRAFRSLMTHLKAIDSDKQTVIMVQVENEMGQLPSARDYSKAASVAFHSAVPHEFIDYLQKNRSTLLPYLKEIWSANGFKTKGNWENVFGHSTATDEIFTAWQYAVYADQVAAAGKAIYNLPMFVNCALNRPNIAPGKYPSGGPLPHLIDIWKAGAPHVDMLSPDIYHGDFREWIAQYDRKDNPVFVPEIKMEAENAAQVFYVVGRHKALGYCPFSVESAGESESVALGKSYKVLEDVSELLLANRQATCGVYLDKSHPSDTLVLGDYRIVVSHVCTLPWTDGAKAEKWTPAGCVVIQAASNEFWIAGTSVTCTFKRTTETGFTTGILSADVALKNTDGWKFIRLNGDQTHQGRHMRMGAGEWQIQRIRLYDYK